MCEYITKRRNFSDINVESMSNIYYETYKEIPSCLQFKHGEKRESVFRNKSTGKLEQISYRLIGAVPFENRPGYYWYWGQIETNDSDTKNACLAFYFQGNGALRSISASFCAKNPSTEGFLRMNEGIKYAAQFTTRGVG